MSEFEHLRHKPPAALERPRELVIACAPMNSGINLSRILRAAGVCGIPRVIACGNTKVDPKIARDGAEHVELETRRSLIPVLKNLREEGYRLVGLEQATGAVSMYEYRFPRKAALVLGNERTGLTAEELRCLQEVVEIPVYGMPHSHNVATAAAIAMYEYCRQYPAG